MKIKTLKPRVPLLAVHVHAPVGRERGATNQRTRARHLGLSPLCVRCELEGRVSLATELDHIVALANGGTNDPANRQGLCGEHHRIKTAEDMGR